MNVKIKQIFTEGLKQPTLADAMVYFEQAYKQQQKALKVAKEFRETYNKQPEKSSFTKEELGNLYPNLNLEVLSPGDLAVKELMGELKGRGSDN